MKRLFVLLLLVVLFAGCTAQPSEPATTDNTPVQQPEDNSTIALMDLTEEENAYIESLRNGGSLKIAMRNLSTVYEVVDGQVRGYNYALISDFASVLNLEVDVKIVPNVTDYYAVDGSIPAQARSESSYAYVPDLLHEVDVYADTITLLPWRKNASRMIPVVPIRELIIKRHETVVESPEDLRNLTITVQPDSSYASTFKALESSMNTTFSYYHVPTIPQSIEAVSRGDADVTIIDSNRAFLEISRFDNLEVGIPLSEVRFVGWAVHPDNELLQSILTKYVEAVKTNGEFERFWKVDYTLTFTDYYQMLSEWLEE